MQDNTLTSASGTTNLPVTKGFWRDVLGQFVTGAFWKGVAKTVAHEMMVAFFTALGGVLVWYGKKKANPEISQGVQNYGMPPQQSPAATAFSGYPRPVTPYSPSYNTPMMSSSPPPPSAADFPGFGPGR